MNNHHQHPWQRRLARTYMLVTALGLSLITLALFVARLVADSPYAIRTLPYFVIASLMAVILLVLAAKGVVGSTCLYSMCLYLFLSFGIIWSVGIGVGSMVLCCIVIILAGSLCGYKCSLLAASISTVFLLAFRAAELQELVHPVYVMSQKPSDFSTALLFALLFHVLAAISGSLYRLEETRRQLREVEAAFARQKGILTNKLKRQSQKLRSAESEKMQQLYRLAEVGEVSTALMHDLANNLTSLALEIDGIETKESSPSVRRAKKQLKQINDVLGRTRQQLKGQYDPKVFDLTKEITHVVGLMETAAKKARVTLEWIKPESSSPGELSCLGEKVLFQQVLTNIINNAIESYGPLIGQDSEKRRVQIILRTKGKSPLLTVTDWGKGIEPVALDRVFEPFYTTKQGGMGMGLYLTRRFIEGNFGGRIEATSFGRQTTFTISLPVTSGPTQA
ncbi:MAG TPA: HAMP domain-containing sensor histidine kinase [Candidatus Limnocylindria bacterium]|nr:HAMP domain-containing sensor histidine kinase [Candidatus Limnocylindria bacterium]